MPTLWDALFGRPARYAPSPTVEYRIDQQACDLDALEPVLQFVTEAIREERIRVCAAQEAQRGDPRFKDKELIWPEAA